MEGGSSTRRWAVGQALAALWFVTSWVESADPECAAPGVTNVLDVISSSDAAALKTLLVTCEGGAFDVAWHGRVAVDDVFTVTNGTRLNVTGVATDADDSTGMAPAAIEGSPGEALFFVYFDGALTLDNLILEATAMADYRASEGAIFAYTFHNDTSETFEPHSPATVNIIDCTFGNYTAPHLGKLYAGASSLQTKRQ